jgi:hypothetical protein
VAAADHEHAAEGHVLPDHQAELGDLRVAEVFPQLADEGFVDASEVRGELLREADGEGVTGLEGPLRFREMDLGDGLFVESLMRSLRIPCEESGIALVHGGDLDPRDLLDPRRGDAFGVRRPEEREEALEEIGQLFRHVQGASVPGVRRRARGRSLLCTHRVSSTSRFSRDRSIGKG